MNGEILGEGREECCIKKMATELTLPSPETVIISIYRCYRGLEQELLVQNLTVLQSYSLKLHQRAVIERAFSSSIITSSSSFIERVMDIIIIIFLKK